MQKIELCWNNLFYTFIDLFYLKILLFLSIINFVKIDLKIEMYLFKLKHDSDKIMMNEITINGTYIWSVKICEHKIKYKFPTFDQTILQENSMSKKIIPLHYYSLKN